MAGKGVMEEIRGLLAQGKSRKEVIALGYAPGTVHKTARRLSRGTEVARKSTGATGGPDSQSAQSLSSVPPPVDEAIAKLERTLHKASLEAELARVRSEAVSLQQLKREVRRLEEWVVRNISDIGQCLVQLRGEPVNRSDFERFVRESLEELRAP